VKLKMPPEVVGQLMDDYSEDLAAMFKLLMEDIFKVIDENPDLSPENIITEIEKLF
jgi:hypothetical protein